MDRNRTSPGNFAGGYFPPYSDPSGAPRTFSTPPQQDFDSEEMQGSLQQILSRNIGEYVVVEFLIGTQMIMRKQGLLYMVGTSYVTLYDDQQREYIICDLFSIKFVYFYYPGDRPRQNFNILPQAPTNGSSASNGVTRR